MTDEQNRDDEQVGAQANEQSTAEQGAAEQAAKPATESAQPEPAAEQAHAPPAAPGPEPPAPERPGDTFKRGLGLLWRAARGAADDLRREVDKAGVSRTLQDAGEKIEHAADSFVKGVERMVEKVQPPSPPPPEAQTQPESPADAAPSEQTVAADPPDEQPKAEKSEICSEQKRAAGPRIAIDDKADE